MDFADAYKMVQQNNEWSAQQAAKQMEFQERMSNTAHQREIEDLKAAGLNPVLSAKLGGASTPSGAMGDTDTSGTSTIIGSLLSAMQAGGYGASSARSVGDSASDSPAPGYKTMKFNLKYVPAAFRPFAANLLEGYKEGYENTAKAIAEGREPDWHSYLGGRVTIKHY